MIDMGVRISICMYSGVFRVVKSGKYELLMANSHSATRVSVHSALHILLFLLYRLGEAILQKVAHVYLHYC